MTVKSRKEYENRLDELDRLVMNSDPKWKTSIDITDIMYLLEFLPNPDYVNNSNKILWVHVHGEKGWNCTRHNLGWWTNRRDINGPARGAHTTGRFQ